MCREGGVRTGCPGCGRPWPHLAHSALSAVGSACPSPTLASRAAHQVEAALRVALQELKELALRAQLGARELVLKRVVTVRVGPGWEQVKRRVAAGLSGQQGGAAGAGGRCMHTLGAAPGSSDAPAHAPLAPRLAPPPAPAPPLAHHLSMRRHSMTCAHASIMNLSWLVGVRVRSLSASSASPAVRAASWRALSRALLCASHRSK